MIKTIHLALCDTNFPDRKQMERLLARESDKRINECVIYMETYGSKEALLQSPRIYDAYFLDIPDSDYSAYQLAVDLQNKGITSPIVFCVSTMNYREVGPLLDNSVFINKPILVKELSLVIDEILLQKEIHYIPTIEFRNSTDVYYLEAKDIVYIEESENNRFFHIHLNNNSVLEAHGFLESAFSEFASYPSFFMPSKKCIVNADYIKKVSLKKIVLTDDTQLAIPFGVAKKINQLLNTLK